MLESGRYVAFALMIAGIALLHAKPIFLHESFHDLTAFHFDMPAGYPSPIKMVHGVIMDGHFPLWYPYGHMGSPALAFYLGCLGHPVTFYAFTLGLNDSMPMFSLINACLMGLFAYLIFRRGTAERWGSAAAGFLLVTTGFTPWAGSVYQVVVQLPWWLCWFWSALGIAQKPSARRFLINAVSLYLVIIAGDPPVLVQGAYLFGSLFFLWTVFARMTIRESANTFIVLVLAGALAIILSLFQIIPTLLMATRMIKLDAFTLNEYAMTFPQAHDTVIASLGLFFRTYRNLFLPFSILVLIAAGFKSKREAPLFRSALWLSLAVLAIVLGGRLGTAAIPYYLPVFGSFFRHYKLGLLLQGPVYFGVAVGFYSLIEALDNRKPGWIALGAICLALSLVVSPGPIYAFILLVLSIGFILCLKIGSLRGYRPLALFLLVAVDSGATLFSSSYTMKFPEPDPVYKKYIREAGNDYRVQGMYAWTAMIAPTMDYDLPPHDSGYFGEYSADTWFDYPLANHAYFLAALCPDSARIENGKALRSKFTYYLKSTDYINSTNRHILNLAGIKYFFLQDMALSEASLFPILSDSDYVGNPRRPAPFSPWDRELLAYRPTGDEEGKNIRRPALVADGPGAFGYEGRFSEGDQLVADLVFGPLDDTSKEAGGKERQVGPSHISSATSWTSLICKSQDSAELWFSRAVSSGESGATRVERSFGPASSGSATLDFSFIPPGFLRGKKLSDSPGEASLLAWWDPRVEKRGKTLQYLEGDRVQVLENKDAIKRARLVHRTKKAMDNDEALSIMRDASRFDPLIETVILDPRAPDLSGRVTSGKESVAIEMIADDAFKIKAEVSSRAYAVVSDAYYPGWRAYNESGEELRIFRADLVSKAVALEKGGHVVTFKYVPIQFRVGLYAFLSSMGLIALTTSAVVFRAVSKVRRGAAVRPH